MPSVTVKISDEQAAALDERCALEGVTRTALVEWAIGPLFVGLSVRPLMLPEATGEILQRIASGQGVDRVDVMRRALIDFAMRTAERWQINAREADRPKLRELRGLAEGEASAALPSVAQIPGFSKR